MKNATTTQNATLLFDRSAQQGRLLLTDRDRLDLLHRMSTNDMNSLPPGAGRSTVLTTALARIIDRLIVYNRGETALMLANYPDVVRGWLQKHIFFQDKVKLRDVSAELAQLELYGPQAAVIAESLAAGVSTLAIHAFRETENGTLVARTFPLAEDGYIIIAPVEARDQLMATIQEHGASEGSDADYEALRIRAGLPGKDHELTETYIPLEANLWDSVSFTKGCYIGQEIIARMESRNKLAKTLVPLHIEGQAVVGSALSDGERSIGTVTSLAPLDDGTMIGLGFVKPERATPGTRLTIAGGEAGSPASAAVITAEVAAPLLNR